MVNLIDIAKKIENDLNLNTMGKVFKVFSDIGELKKRSKRKNEYRNGLIELISSNNSRLNGLNFVEMGITLTIYANDDLRGKDDGESVEVIELREILNQFIDSYNFKTSNEEWAGKNYITTYVVQSPTTLPRTSLGYINDCLPLQMHIGITFFENGVNANDYLIEIDGYEVPFTQAIISRVKTVENQPLMTSKNTQAVTQTTGFGLDLVMPQINNELCDNLEEELLTGKEYAHLLYLKGRKHDGMYICVQGDSKASLVQNANVGYNVSLVEGVPELLKYDENKWVEFEIEVEDISEGVYIYNNDKDNIVVFLGDGNSIQTDVFQNIYYYKKPGIYTIRAYNKNAIDDKWLSLNYYYFNITFDTQGGGIFDDKKVLFGKAIGELPTPDKDGYSFIKWQIDNIDIDANTVWTYEENKVATAVYEERFEYILFFNTNGGSSHASKTVTLNSEIGELPTPSKLGYNFVNWKIDNIDIDANTVWTYISNKTANANWNTVEYTISYSLNGGNVSGNATTYTIEDKVVISNPTKNGYTFTGWSGTGISGKTTSLIIPIGSVGNRVFTANWEIIEYTISYNLGGGDVKSGETLKEKYTINDNIVILNLGEKIEKFGYEIDKVYINNINTDYFYATDLENKNVEVVWKAKEYKITFDVNGGVKCPSERAPLVFPPNPKYVKYGERIDESFNISNYYLSYVCKDGFIPTGWYIGNTKLTDSTIWYYTEDKTVVLGWEQI